MKTSMTIKSITLITLLAAAFAAPVLAQGAGGGGGMGYGMGGGPCVQNGGPGAGGQEWDQADAACDITRTTRGWSLMTADERTAFQKQMREVKTYDECVALQTEHRGAMEVRAKEKGASLATPRRNVCDNLQARGLIK